jgi:hypothetical protein
VEGIDLDRCRAGLTADVDALLQTLGYAIHTMSFDEVDDLHAALTNGENGKYFRLLGVSETLDLQEHLYQYLQQLHTQERARRARTEPQG